MIRLEAEIKHIYTLKDGDKPLAVLTAQARGDSVEIHNDVFVPTPKTFKLMREHFNKMQAQWKMDGFKYVVAVIPVKDYTEMLGKFRSFFGFKFTTIQHGYHCAVKELV